MFEQVYDSLRQATEGALRAQQEVFQKWLGLWPITPPAPLAWGEQARQVQQKWVAFTNDLFRRQREAAEAQFKAALEGIEKAFHVGEAKTVEEMRTRILELYQKSFEGIKQAIEVQFREFQAAVEKWTEMMTKAA
jgi:hypothetical protein